MKEGWVEVPQTAAKAQPVVARDYARDIRAMRDQKALQSRAAMRSRFRVHPPTLCGRAGSSPGAMVCSVHSVRSSVPSVFQTQTLWLRRQPR
jgi:hypothetical protein